MGQPVGAGFRVSLGNRIQRQTRGGITGDVEMQLKARRAEFARGGFKGIFGEVQIALVAALNQRRASLVRL